MFTVVLGDDVLFQHNAIPPGDTKLVPITLGSHPGTPMTSTLDKFKIHSAFTGYVVDITNFPSVKLNTHSSIIVSPGTCLVIYTYVTIPALRRHRLAAVNSEYDKCRYLFVRALEKIT